MGIHPRKSLSWGAPGVESREMSQLSYLEFSVAPPAPLCDLVSLRDQSLADVSHCAPYSESTEHPISPFLTSWLLLYHPPPHEIIKSLCWALEFEHCIVFCEFDMMCMRRWWETPMGDVQQGRSSELRSVEMMPTERIIDFLVYSTYPPGLERGRDLRICTGEWSDVLYFSCFSKIAWLFWLKFLLDYFSFLL